ncbi:hypothetical protein KXD93_16740 [Mucilaginibacter sp. BJC16-A38]|uniref:hypothetical protein n=1 Tax=Mucilaginibacter phenanthrenivorans TaxID=1234842 RepID=UPI00215849C0|nr:hypothetical protein [Mucilaginibacter phenanthrenivorans]MCR8559307.1 hypothetical protein [Mucilaginibacter phenanthrenivorans]
MEPRILTDAELAKEQLFKSKVRELEIQFSKPINLSLWTDDPKLIFLNGEELDSSIRDKVIELHKELF